MLAYRLHVLVGLVLVVATLTSKTKHTQSDVFHNRRNRQANNSEARHYCGDRLTSALQKICDSVYYARFKRNDQETEKKGSLSSNDFHPYKSIENAKKMLKVRRLSRGIREECCLGSCSMEELRSYCGSQ
ncbi:insulin-like peptide 2 [Nomia melanderi]|uniref:insulin-like peptide 2 n=1 Tax=Nomia melanderi TaxID=2448451 RepID=UPI0013042FD1|nr:LIRP [Nomia melanderi]